MCTRFVTLNSVDSPPVYLKTLCLVETQVDYNVASQSCIDNRMVLFAMTNKQLYDAYNAMIVPFQNNNYPLDPFFRTWLNGKKNSANIWMTYTPNEIPLYVASVTWEVNAEVGSYLTGFRNILGKPILEGRELGIFSSYWYWCSY